MSFYPDITKTIGHTPLVQLSRLFPGSTRVLAKIESFNPGGSVKDRVALAIVEAAEASGALPPGGTLVEATSGNTGVGLAMVGAARGYRVVIAMPASMSRERRLLMRAYGAEVILTDPQSGMAGAVEAAERIVAQRPGAVLASQFNNPANPHAHYLRTGAEIWEQTGGEVDVVVAGVGTGGTISGVGKALRERGSATQLVAVEPAESALITTGEAGPHGIQGIGANFIPDNYDASVVDQVLAVTTAEAMEYARKVAATEGILVGISSGAALAAVAQLLRDHQLEGKTVVVVLPDTGERYLSTALWSDLDA
ncbi:MAG: cysteine synthase A [Actinomycetaceae bacterium]|nr:cysteine synthase A [Actinomycetaceae bacterium]